MSRSSGFSRIVKIRDLDDGALVKLSKKLGLALSDGEMFQLRDYFRGIGRDPTDVEIQAMAQAWSEHCCYKSSKLYLKKYLSGLRNGSVILAMEDDAGVVAFDDDHAYVLKMESHNHPSAVEPYGGAATGVGGIIRDVLCMGAQPVAILDSLYFGDPEFQGDAKGSHSTKFLASGVVRGIKDYGNRLGIPTVAGSVYFHEGYNRNPLVNAGCVGILEKKNVIRSRASRPGEVLVLIGGGTGRDGIHGVNFASSSLDSENRKSTRSVQLGNPIIEEPLIHAILEMVDANLINGMKDLGGGGLSSAAGEILYAASLSGIIDLDKVHLKDKGMDPWEIWVSESQERMLVTMDPESVKKAQPILKKWDLDSSVIGKVTDGGNLVIQFKGEKVLDLPLEFLTSGPVYARSYHESKPSLTTAIPMETKNYSEFLKNFLSSPNVSSRFRIIREYDRTVRGGTAVSAEVGSPGLGTHSDSAIVVPLPGSRKALILTSGCKVPMVEADPYSGTLASLCEGVRNIICSGGRPHSLVDSLNFGDPEDPEIMGQLVTSLRAIGDFSREFDLPVVSGNVSLYNRSGEVNIPPTPTFMIVGLLEDASKSLSSDFKENGNSIFLLGRILPNLSGSEYLRYSGIQSGAPSPGDLKDLKYLSHLMERLSSRSLVISAHDVSTGGLSVCIAEMCFGNGIGAEVDLSSIYGMRTSVKLFSEAGNAVVVEVPHGKEDEFLKECTSLKPLRIGTTGGGMLRINDLEIVIVDSPVKDLMESWNSGLEKILP